MREIKFRAWAGGVMVFFDLFNITTINGYDQNRHFQRTEHPHLSVSNICPIMQYTGIKDKNGVEIYEGDIVRILSQPEPKNTKLHHLYRRVVEWNAKTAGWSISPKRTAHKGYLVLGNIYKNPELLEKES